MKRMIAAIGLTAVLSLTSVAFAESASTVSGTVKKVDQSAEKITLDHGPIKNLDMDSMTMVFKAGDKAMLTKVKAGDKVKFSADRVNGQLTVTKIEKAK